ncbi:MAG: SAM hydrolase/SAM-dependent halogenase family protein [Myxococcota bacterium]
MTIALLTDFGLSDPYVGVMKGVIAGIAPGVPVLDVTHGVPPQDVRVGALFLDAAWPFFPPATVFVCVVDPGVGTDRRPVVARAADRWFVGPDNGLFTLLPSPEVWAIEAGPLPSRTFHGRDLFAPVAARLALAQRFDGPVIGEPVRLAIPAPRGDVGEVLYVDHFGNAVTNLPARDDGAVRVRGRRLRVVRAYGEADLGEAVALTGSTSRLEVAVRDGSAAAELGIAPGEEVAWEPS